jgi:hypothetical protein
MEAAVTMGDVIKHGLTHMVLVVCGALGLFDDVWLPPLAKKKGQEDQAGQEGERQNRSSFPSALSGVCHYIIRNEAKDRGRFVRALCEAFINLCQANNKRKETYKHLIENKMKKTSLTSSHLESSERDAKWQVDALDKFGLLVWFTETTGDTFKWVELGSAEFDTRLQALQLLNPRWTRAVVSTMLRDLRFKEPSAGHAPVAPGWQCEWRMMEPSTSEHANALADVAAAAAAAAPTAARPGNLTIADLERARQHRRQGRDAEAAQAAPKRSKPETNETASKKAKTGPHKALP